MRRNVSQLERTIVMICMHNPNFKGCVIKTSWPMHCNMGVWTNKKISSSFIVRMHWSRESQRYGAHAQHFTCNTQNPSKGLSWTWSLLFYPNIHVWQCHSCILFLLWVSSVIYTCLAMFNISSVTYFVVTVFYRLNEQILRI